MNVLKTTFRHYNLDKDKLEYLDKDIMYNMLRKYINRNKLESTKYGRNRILDTVACKKNIRSKKCKDNIHMYLLFQKF